MCIQNLENDVWIIITLTLLQVWFLEVKGGGGNWVNLLHVGIKNQQMYVFLRWQNKKKHTQYIIPDLRGHFILLTAKGSTSSAKVPGTWRTATRPKAHRKLKVYIVVGKSRTVNLRGPQVRFIYEGSHSYVANNTQTQGHPSFKRVTQLKIAFCQRGTCEISLRMYGKQQVCVYGAHMCSSWLLIRGHALCSICYPFVARLW